MVALVHASNDEDPEEAAVVSQKAVWVKAAGSRCLRVFDQKAFTGCVFGAHVLTKGRLTL